MTWIWEDRTEGGVFVLNTADPDAVIGFPYTAPSTARNES